MAKKAEDTEIKKECPSCGLGVALDSKMCEFCGWDFDEEDEWILQIEKLERDLLLEKQKFEPGSVEDKIESTLRSPFYQKADDTSVPVQSKTSPKAGTAPSKPLPKAPVIAPPVLRETKASGVKVVRPFDTEEEPKPEIRTTARAPAPVVETRVKPTPTPAPAPVRPVARAEEPTEVAQEAPKAPAQKTRKTRVVRKVKQG